MKKILVLFLAIFIMALFSVPVFATATTGGVMGSTAGYTTSVKLSANVLSSYLGGTLGVSYAATTSNPKGMGRAYGTASDTTYITYEPWTTTTAAPTPTAADSSAVTSGSWKKIGE